MWQLDNYSGCRAVLLHNIRLFVHLFIVCSSYSCNKPSDSAVISPTDNSSSCKAGQVFRKGVLVVNEGNYGSTPGSLTFCDSSGKVIPDVFNCVNGRVAGNVCQSLYSLSDKLYLVVNNSQKVEVLNARTLQTAGQIKGLRSPRYMLSPDGLKAYITDLYSDSITIVRLSDNHSIGKIYARGWTNKMVLLNGLVYITQQKTLTDTRPAGENILVLNPASDRITDSIQVGIGIGEIAADSLGRLWVLAAKGLTGSSPVLCAVNPVTKAVVYNKALAEGKEARALVTDKAGKKAYFICGDVFELQTDLLQPELKLFYPQGSGLYYGLGVSPSGDVYVSNAKDYITSGRIYRLNPSGIVADSFSAGTIPGCFDFLP